MSDESSFPEPPLAASQPIIGHSKAELQVLDAWNSGRFPHAWLIVGPKGVGKATLAYRIARFVLAQGGADAPLGDMFGGGPTTLEIESSSSTFRQIASGGHPDFRALEKPEDKTVISVDQARDVVTFAGKTAAQGGWKVVLVDSADDLNRNSANALLKALEEPASKGLFLLISHAPGRLLPTIRSRCRTLTLTAVELEETDRALQSMFPSLPQEERQVVSALSEGCPGRAVSLAGQGGADLYRALLELCSKPQNIDMTKVLRLGDQLARKDAAQTYNILRELIDFTLKRAIRAQAAGTQLPDIINGDASVWHKLISLGSVSNWLQAASEIVDELAKADPPAYLGRKHVLINAFVRLEQAAKGG